ncbi:MULTISPECIES: alanine/glycine:cation symporter family protein [Prosthecochloris]|uniref:Alanine:cation symporter family protein n=1 Tax=Prosthecochloris vibrioformis TaxID=1098 RepID=A0A5C4S3E3_PROVB|nr:MULTISPECIES: alanine/glycine:cation symporter family protein [Prosthecochloris]ANT65690.1 Amino-acid carrier protein AlsT [Prosthecochloris sp. CIB 2401]TNJ37934.1 alanine:cation symporter family protein [Prosthecochloris vibrioformis]
MKYLPPVLCGAPAALLFPRHLFAATATPGIDERINSLMEPLTALVFQVVFFTVSFGGVTVPFVLLWLVVAALVFTLYLGFVNIRGFSHAIDLVRGVYDAPGDQKGEVSHFQALTAALSATVGLGNIAGVAVAITLGGPGATLWMIVGGFLGMSSKMVECTLGVKYRKVFDDGRVSGGPMYYLSRGLAEKGFPSTGKVLGFFFALMCVGGSIGGGNMFQANQAFKQAVVATGGAESFLYQQGWIFGLCMALLVGIVIIGGIKSIVRVTSKLVPLMVAIYVLVSLYIIFSSWTDIPAAFGIIITGAFAPEALYGGVVGVLIQGFKRAAFSNEAGIGSAPIAHSAVKTSEPVTEGLVALLEPFLDTVVICTMTALVIVISGLYVSQGVDGIALTSSAFAQSVSWFPSILSIAVLLFAFSTMISWSYYGLKAWTYMFGEGRAADLAYKLIFCGFIVIGAAMNLGTVIDFTDAMIFAMSFPNIIGLYLLAPGVKRDLDDYFARLRQGEIRRFR